MYIIFGNVVAHISKNIPITYGIIDFFKSAFSSTLSSYSIDFVTEKKMGLKLVLKGEKEEVKFVSPKMKEREKEFRKALGWPEE